jgi:hypothetical protein
MSNETPIRIYVDFNNRDENGTIVINTGISEKKFLEDLVVEGMCVVLYDETLEVRAKASWNGAIGFWVANPDWETIHHYV